MRYLLLLVSCCVAALPVNAEKAPAVSIAATPARALLERMPDAQHLNIDLQVSNLGDEALDIDRIELSAYDDKGALLLRRFIDGNGVRPSVDVIGPRRIEPGETRNVFNPFATFAHELEIASLRFRFELSNADGSETLRQEVVVSPRHYRNHARYVLPVGGRLINYDGHDELGHHRRFDVEFPPIKALGFKSNAMRYSYDFVRVDAKGEMYAGDFADNAAWFGFGADIRAIGDGVVVAVETTQPDDRKFDQSKLAQNRWVLMGNYVVIDHGGGEFGVYAHARHNSVVVKPGERVRRGQTIAQIGASGSAFFPHLHFQLQDGDDFDAEGLPSYFDRFARVLGSRHIKRQQASIDTGEIVEAE